MNEVSEIGRRKSYDEQMAEYRDEMKRRRKYFTGSEELK
jgi:hypothetical protein